MADLHYTSTTTREYNVHRAIIVATLLVRPLNPRHRDIKQKRKKKRRGGIEKDGKLCFSVGEQLHQGGRLKTRYLSLYSGSHSRGISRSLNQVIIV